MFAIRPIFLATLLLLLCTTPAHAQTSPLKSSGTTTNPLDNSSTDASDPDGDDSDAPPDTELIKARRIYQASGEVLYFQGYREVVIPQMCGEQGIDVNQWLAEFHAIIKDTVDKAHVLYDRVPNLLYATPEEAINAGIKRIAPRYREHLEAEIVQHKSTAKSLCQHLHDHPKQGAQDFTDAESLPASFGIVRDYDLAIPFPVSITDRKLLAKRNIVTDILRDLQGKERQLEAADRFFTLYVNATLGVPAYCSKLGVNVSQGPANFVARYQNTYQKALDILSQSQQHDGASMAAHPLDFVDADKVAAKLAPYSTGFHLNQLDTCRFVANAGPEYVQWIFAPAHVSPLILETLTGERQRVPQLETYEYLHAAEPIMNFLAHYHVIHDILPGLCSRQGYDISAYVAQVSASERGLYDKAMSILALDPAFRQQGIKPLYASIDKTFDNLYGKNDTHKVHVQRNCQLMAQAPASALFLQEYVRYSPESYRFITQFDLRAKNARYSLVESTRNANAQIGTTTLRP